jgi:hypothetical protein
MALGGMSVTATAQTEPAQRPAFKVVLELFTSQGCSSCPPADALLESYTKRDDVIALSVPVDYWDRLGWKDTFASREHTLRQQAYASARGDGQVYTPQIVVSGSAHVVGSSRSSIDDAITTAKRTLRDSHIPLRVHLEGGELVVQAVGAPPATRLSDARLFLAVVQEAGTVAIRRGENANRSVTYHNIVRSFKPIGNWTGTAMTLRVPMSEYALGGAESVVVLVQKGTGGPILGAAQVRISGKS